MKTRLTQVNNCNFAVTCRRNHREGDRCITADRKLNSSSFIYAFKSAIIALFIACMLWLHLRPVLKRVSKERDDIDESCCHAHAPCDEPDRFVDPSVKFKRILLKMSGEILQGDREYGIDQKTIDRIALDVREVVRPRC
jgi:flagellar biosynthesis/type III secretory pathway M-ring protein FliF/YscJ